VFEPESEFVKRVPKFIEQGAAVAQSILRDHAGDPVSVEAIRAYFELLYSLQDGQQAFDVKSILACFDKDEGFDFKTAAQNFRIIEDNTVSIIIPFDVEAMRLIEELKFSTYPASTIRKLQPYSINIYEQEYQALNGKGAIEVISDHYAALSDASYYDQQTGVIIPEGSSGDAIFF
jgi:CRISPR-associated endonuclease/helicase Cas3